MEIIERLPLPPVCAVCREPDCRECDHAGERWILSEEDQQAVSRKMKERAAARYQRLLPAGSAPPDPHACEEMGQQAAGGTDCRTNLRIDAR